MINETVRRGLSGLHVLGGVPATVGGALVMNAGGTFGQIADSVVKVHAIDRQGREVTLDRAKIGEMAPGGRARVLDQDDDGFRVVTDDGTQGWVSRFQVSDTLRRDAASDSPCEKESLPG